MDGAVDGIGCGGLDRMECWATLSRTGCREGRQGSLTGPGHVGSGPGRVRELGYSHTRRACRTVAISTLGNYLGESVARVAVVQLAERGSARRAELDDRGKRRLQPVRCAREPGGGQRGHQPEDKTELRAVCTVPDTGPQQDQSEPSCLTDRAPRPCPCSTGHAPTQHHQQQSTTNR